MKRIFFLATLFLAKLSLAAPPVLEQGSTFQIAGKTATLAKLDALPFVESDYSKRFKFDAFTNPKLKRLRERYKLDEVVAPGKDEFDRQIHLMEWTHRQFKKFGRPSTEAKGALEVLKGIEDGHSFFCTQYAQVLVSAAASVGWVDRPLALRRHRGVNKVGGSTEHTTTEIWSNQYRKWIMLDPTSNLYVEMNGIPLNAWEIRKNWFEQGGKKLVFVVGTERKRYRKSDLPVMLGRFDGFGDLTFEPDEPDKYGFIGYVPNTDLMDSPYDYGKMFIVKDAFCEGTRWHTRDLPDNPAVDPYFPIGQAAFSLNAENGKLNVSLKTLTPNFKQFEIRQGEGRWKLSGDQFEWPVGSGTNRLEARTVNLFGVQGPISTIEVKVHDE
jgi:hypothetical protein